MVSTRTKFFIVILGVLWCFLLVFMMTSFDWVSKGKRSFGIKEPHFESFDKISLGKSSRTHAGHVIQHPKKVEKPHETHPSSKMKRLGSSHSNKDKKIMSVVIAGNEGTLMGVVAAINSVHVNTNSTVHFFVALPKKLIPHFKYWMSESKSLAKIKYVVRQLPPSIPQANYQFAKLFFTDIFPELHGNVIYLDADTIVRGDIKELDALRLKDGHLIFASNECHSLSKHKSRNHPYYSSRLNMKHPRIISLDISPKTCAFNTDVFVANVTEWRRRNIPKDFKRWIKFSKSSDPLHGAERDTDNAESIMLLTFYQHVGYLDQMWHVGHLGSDATSPISLKVISEARLLHWNGHFKPWSRRAPFSQEWQKYFVKDPARKYAPVRKKS